MLKNQALSFNNKPFAPACERNKQYILERLKRLFCEPGLVLEIGSGTGQHGVYFAEHIPHITWQFSDQSSHILGIEQWVMEANLKNVRLPITLDVRKKPWPIESVDYVFTANTLHIMDWEAVEVFLQSVKDVLNTDGLLCIYGPFNYNGYYTSDSNANFDQSLRAQNPEMGIRDFVAINVLLEKNGLKLQHDYTMPANNRLLVYQRLAD